VPVNATIDSCTLRFVLAESIPPKTYYTLNIIDPQTNKNIKNIDKISYREKTPVVAGNEKLRLLVSQGLKKRNQAARLNIKLSTSSVGGMLKLYSELTSTGIIGTDYSLLPRLIVYYSVAAPNPGWNGFEADAQHDGRTVTDIYGSNPVNNETIPGKEIYDGQLLTPPCVYNNRLWFMYSFGSKPYICSLDPVTKDISVISGNISTLTNFAPVMDRFGRYYFLNANSISYWDPADKIIKEAVHFDEGNIPRTNLTIGKDGSLYVVMLKNAFAYSPYPFFKKLWQYNYESSNNVTTDGASPVTLSNDDAFAYIVTVTNNTAAYKKIILLNTLTGKPDKQIVLSLKDVDTRNIPVLTPTPVIGNNDNVFLTNGYPTGDTMYIFNKKLTSRSAIGDLNISQPVVANRDSVFYFTNKALFRIIKTSASNVQDLGNNINIINAALAGKYIYAVDGISGTNRVLVLSPSDKIITQTTATTTNYASLVVAPDGSAYVTTTNHIIAVRNRSFVNTGNVFTNAAASRQNAVFRAGQLRVDSNLALINKQILIGINEINFGKNVTLNNAAGITIQSGGPIRFQTGFKVKQGATLSCKTGY
jgi:hypothetical protein